MLQDRVQAHPFPQGWGGVIQSAEDLALEKQPILVHLNCSMPGDASRHTQSGNEGPTGGDGYQ